MLVAILARNKWGLSLWIVIPAAAVSLLIDGAFFISNLTKFMHGGWFPLVIAVIIVAILSTWQWGRKRLASRLESLQASAQELPAYLGSQHIVRTPGVAIYPTVEEGIPIALLQRIALVHAVNDVTVVLHLLTADTPHVNDENRLEIISGAVIDVTATYGYMERPDLLDVVRHVNLVHPEVDPDTCTFVFHTMNIETTETNPIKRIPTELFTIMQRNATDPQHYFGLPADRVLEFGRLIKF
jgi:KUP system potassium uptake protein